MSALVQEGERDRRFELIALACFAIVLAIVSASHEPWNAETQSWRLAIDSDGLAALAHNARYEGHPLLYHFVLQLVGHLSRAWWAAVVTNALIACTAAWIVLRYAPFGRVERALVIGGYFVLYEYGVIVREYGLGVLFAFAACAAWTAERRRWIVAIVCLVLMANTSVLGFLVALAAGAAFVMDVVWPDGPGGRRFTRRTLAIAATCLVLAALLAMLVARQVVPPESAAYKGEGVAVQGRMSAYDIGWGLTLPLRAMLPIARIGEGTVQANRWLFEPGSRATLAIEVLLSGAVVILGCVMTMRRRTALVFFLIGTLGLVAFFLLFVRGFARHHGHIAIVWIMAAWLSRSGPPTAWPSFIEPLADRARRLAPRVLRWSLVPMTLAAAEFSIGDVVLPYADVVSVANLLRSRGLVDRPIIGVARSNAAAVGALLDRDVFLPREGRRSKFVIWGDRGPEVPPVAVIERLADSLLTRQCEIVVISTLDDDVPEPLVARLRLIYQTPYRPMTRERFRVWTMSAAELSGCPASPAMRPPGDGRRSVADAQQGVVSLALSDHDVPAREQHVTRREVPVGRRQLPLVHRHATLLE
jgi:hypothetical protein